MGSPAFAVPALRALALHGAGHEIVCVYSQPPRPSGRGHAVHRSAVHEAALAMGLPVRTPARVRRDTVEHDAFAALDLDAAVVAAYGLILPPAMLGAPRRGCLNIHASLLPRWRGAAPIQAAIMAGDAESGVTIMQMDEGLDTGPMLLRGTVPITPETTAVTLLDSLSALGARLIVDALRDWPAPVPQPEQGATYAAKLTREDGRLDFTRPAEAAGPPGARADTLARHVRRTGGRDAEDTGRDPRAWRRHAGPRPGQRFHHRLRPGRAAAGPRAARRPAGYVRRGVFARRARAWPGVKRWALLLEYDGTGFAGWQRQAKDLSVQAVLEEAAARLEGRPVACTAAGRTDAGVHAIGQVVHLDIARDMTGEKLAAALNFHMKPHRIVVREAACVPPGWNARFAAIGRLYRYTILNRAARPGLDEGRVWHVRPALDVDAMCQGAAALLGQHDFTSFRATSCQAKSPVRTLDRLDVSRHGERIVLVAEARSFLHHQVRNIVGSLKLVGEGRWPVSRIADALAARERSRRRPHSPSLRPGAGKS